jgi:hypothetical protein
VENLVTLLVTAEVEAVEVATVVIHEANVTSVASQVTLPVTVDPTLVVVAVAACATTVEALVTLHATAMHKRMKTASDVERAVTWQETAHNLVKRQEEVLLVVVVVLATATSVESLATLPETAPLRLKPAGAFHMHA